MQSVNQLLQFLQDLQNAYTHCICTHTIHITKVLKIKISYLPTRYCLVHVTGNRVFYTQFKRVHSLCTLRKKLKWNIWNWQHVILKTSFCGWGTHFNNRSFLTLCKLLHTFWKWGAIFMTLFYDHVTRQILPSMFAVGTWRPCSISFTQKTVNKICQFDNTGWRQNDTCPIVCRW